MKHWANSRALPAMPRLRGTTSQTARGDGDTCSGALCRHASLWNADTELAPRGSRTSGAERRTFSLTATGHFCLQQEFDTTSAAVLQHFTVSRYPGTSTLKCRFSIGAPKSKIANDHI